MLVARWMCVWVCENKDVCILNPTRALATHWPGSHHWTPTPVPLTCCWMFPLDSPSVGIHHFTSTGSLCGPENRPNPLGPRSHQVTHIVRFVTHPAQKSKIWTSQSSKKVRPFTVATQYHEYILYTYIIYIYYISWIYIIYEYILWRQNTCFVGHVYNIKKTV